jgi:response regulator RpfG family c-di-GMP phosphodiesterase
VDDERLILSALRRLLRNENYDLLVATSGPEGLALLAQREVQLVVSDYRMPEMLGDEFLKEVQRLYPRAARMMLTGYSDANIVKSFTESGELCGIAFKPWEDDKLKGMIRNCLACCDSNSHDSEDT